MTWWLTWALAAPLCQELALGELPTLSLPDPSPASTTRCLDEGSTRETLLARARRCVEERPEDPAPVRVLGALGGKQDVPILEALATSGWHTADASESLGLLDHPTAREALRRVACRAEDWKAPVEVLLWDPRPEELDLYVEGLEVNLPGASRGIGAVGVPRGRRLLIARSDRRGLAADHHPDAVAALEALVVPTEGAIRVLRSLEADHPLYVPLLDRLWEEPQLELYLPELSAALPDAEARPRLEKALREVGPRPQRILGHLLQREPERFPELAEAIRAHGPPHAQLGLLEHARERRDEVWAMVDDPVAGWAAAEWLLLLRDTDAERGRALAERVLAEAPEDEASVRNVARGVLDGTLPRPGLFEVADGTKPSRPRTPVRDVEALRSTLREASGPRDRARRQWIAAVGPWIWEGPDDLRELRTLTNPSALVDAGDPEGLAQLKAFLGARPRPRRVATSASIEALRRLDEGHLPAEGELWRIASHHGQRWRLVEALDDLDPQASTPVLEALLTADWRRQAPPSEVVVWARSQRSIGAVRVLALVGEVGPLREALQSAEPGVATRTWKALFELVTTAPEPHAASVALVAEGLAARSLSSPELVAAWKVPALRGALALDRCATVRLASEPGFEIPDAELLVAIRSCGQVPKLSADRGARIQGALLASGDVALALTVHPAPPEVIETYLGDPTHRLAALQQLTRIPPTDGAWPRLEGWLATWGEEDREAFRTLERVFRTHRSAAGLRILGERIREANDPLVVDTLIGRSGDALEVLIPVVGRGGPVAERVALRIRGVSEAVYHRHQALIDAELAPSWEVRE